MRLPSSANIALVGVGGAVGALVRAAVAEALPDAAGGWPTATMVANVSGALLLGLVLGVVSRTAVVGWWVRPLVATGVLGGYTTFSTLSVQAFALVADGRALLAGAYTAGSAFAGLAAMWAGATVASVRPRGRGAR